MHQTELLKIEKKIASNIKKVRILNNHTQKDIADALGVTYQQVQKYESGGSKISAGNLFLISLFLDVPVTYFYDLASDFLSDEQESTHLDTEALKLLKMFKSIKNPRLRKKAIKLCAILRNDPLE